MTEFIQDELKRTAIVLADTQSFVAAGKQLGTAPQNVENRIRELESKLCMTLFVPDSDPPTVTDTGRFLNEAFRQALDRR